MENKEYIYKELMNHERDLIFKKYRLGEGYKRISTILDVLSNTMNAIMNK